MSFEVNIFVPDVRTTNLKANLINRFARLGMEWEFHPKFSFDQEKDSGFLPVRMKVDSSDAKHYRKQYIISGFEIYIDDFESGKIDNVVGSGQNCTEAIGRKLKGCHKQITLVIQPSPSSEFRTGMYFAGAIAELTNGVFHDPQSDHYVDSDIALEYCASEVSEFEKQISENEWKLIPFSGWLD